VNLPADKLRRRAEAVCTSVLDHAPEGSVSAVFVGGSVARDEVWSAAIDGILEIYSDVDLYVVVDDDARAGQVRDACRAVTSALPRGDDGTVFVRGVETGVYTVDDLLGQPVRPGTVDLGRTHIWLHGDPALADAMREALDRPVPPGEALYLLENRAWDLTEPPGAGGATARRVRRVREAKAMLDVASAHLIAAGEFVPSLAERMRIVSERPPASMDPSTREGALAAFERYRDLSSFLSGDGAGELPVGRWMAETWRALFTTVVPGIATDEGTLLDRRCARGFTTRNYVEFVRMRRGLGRPRWTSALLGLTCAQRSPRASLRVHALARELAASVGAAHATMRGHFDYVDRVTRALGFNDGGLDDRARLAHRAVS